MSARPLTLVYTNLKSDLRTESDLVRAYIVLRGMGDPRADALPAHRPPLVTPYPLTLVEPEIDHHLLT